MNIRPLFCALLIAGSAEATEPPQDTSCRDQAAWGYLDKTGAMIIAPQFRSAAAFADGLAAVQSKEGPWGFVDPAGKWAIPARYEYAESFREGLACVRDKGKLVIIDKLGAPKITGVSSCYAYHDGLARLEKDGKAGYHDATGKRVVEVDSDDLGSYGDFSEGVASIYEEGLLGKITCGHVDAKGVRRLVEPKGEVCIGVHDMREGRARLFVKHGEHAMRVGFVDEKGTVVIAPTYAGAGAFHEGLAAVEKGELWGFVDKAGKTVIPITYDYVSINDQRDGIMDDYPRFSEGLAMLIVGKGAKQHPAYLEKTGKVRFDAKGALLARDFHDGLAYVLWEDRSAYLDPTGKPVIDAKDLREAQDFHEGRAAVCKLRR